jgi:hypothetical protein
MAITLFAACSASGADRSTEVTPTVPNVPVPPKPSIALSSDSVVTSLLSGAPTISQDIDITAGNSTNVSGLAVVDSAGAAPTGWLTASLSSTTAPAKLSVRVSPNLAVGRYEATLRVTAANADPRLVRVALVVRPRPRLVVERTALAFSGDLGGASIAAQEIAITSVDGAIDSLSVGKAECGNEAAAWLTPTLSATKAPATLKLVASAGALGAGTYSCSLTVSTSQPLVDSASHKVTASLTLRATPRIRLSADSVSMLTFRLNDAAPATVAITNVGTGTLSGLSIGPIEYEEGGSGWLTARLDSSTAPATLTLSATARSLASGTYLARVPVQSSAEGVANTPRVVVVRLSVSPLPSSLIAIPSTINVTVPAGGVRYLTASVTHSGDNSLSGMGFGPFTPLLWVQYSLGCTGNAATAANFTTPCTAYFVVAPPAGLAPGTYTVTPQYLAVTQNMRTTVTLIVRVTP